MQARAVAVFLVAEVPRRDDDAPELAVMPLTARLDLHRTVRVVIRRRGRPPREPTTTLGRHAVLDVPLKVRVFPSFELPFAPMLVHVRVDLGVTGPLHVVSSGASGGTGELGDVGRGGHEPPS